MTAVGLWCSISNADTKVPLQSAIDDIEQRLVRVQVTPSKVLLADLETLLGESKTRLGASHSLTLLVQHELGVQYLFRDPQKALDILNSNRLLFEQQNLNTEVYRGTLYNTVTALQSLHRYEEALAFATTLVESQMHLGRRYAGRLLGLKQYIEVALVLAEYDLAEQALHTLQRLQKVQLGSQHPDLLRTASLQGLILMERGELDASAKILQKVFQKQQRSLGMDAVDTLSTQHHLGQLFRLQGETEQAEHLLEDVLSRRTKVLGVDHPDTIASMNNLALLYLDMGLFTKSEQLLETCLHTLEAEVGKVHPNTIAVLNNTAQLYLEEGRFVEAKNLFEQVKTLEEQFLPKTHPDLIRTTQNLAMSYVQLGDLNRAEDSLQTMIEVCRERLGAIHSLSLSLQSNYVSVLLLQGRYEQMESVLQEVYAQQLATLGDTHLETVATQSSLINLYIVEGRLEQADQLVSQTLEKISNAHELSHPTYLQLVQDRAMIALHQGRSVDAEADFTHILNIERETLGSAHFKTIQTMKNIGLVYQAQGMYQKAESLFQQAVQQQESTLGDTHPQVLESQSILAALYEDQGQYAKAEPLLLTVVHNAKGVFGSYHPVYLRMMGRLGSLYAAQGRFGESIDVYRFVQQTFETVVGLEHPYTIEALNGLATVLQEQQRFEDIQPILEKVAKGAGRVYGDNHPNTWQAKGALGNNLQSLQRYTEAEPILVEVYTAQREHLGPKHPQTVTSMVNLANLYTEQERYAEAKPLLFEALSIQQELFGDVHPQTMDTIRNAIRLLMSVNDVDAALQWVETLLQAEDKFLFRNSIGSDDAQRQFHALFAETTNLVMTLVLNSGSDNPKAVQVAVEMWLNRQGRLLDQQMDLMAIYERDLGDAGTKLLARQKQLLLQDAELRNQDFQNNTVNRLQAIQQDLAEVEGQLSRLSQRFRQDNASIELSSIQATLAPTDQMVLYSVISPDPQQPTLQTLVAFVVTAEKVSMTNLGALGDIPERIQALRQTRSSILAQDLYLRLVDPLGLEQSGQWIVVPDGPLHLVPVDLLKPNANTYLIDKVQVSYRTTGRDQLDQTGVKSIQSLSASSVTVIANPQFPDDWNPLPNTAIEAQLIQQIAPQSSVYLGEDASLSTIRNIQSPTILHVATHGFVEDDDPMDSSDDSPMVRAGLVLSSPTGNGYLRAAEVGMLNLDRTQLVVLSACESGLGVSSAGDGVYGLRRALKVAGAQRQLLSLWPISDEGTKTFMTMFYQYLAENPDPTMALRNTQMAMKDSEGWSNPVFWAGFILVE